MSDADVKANIAVSTDVEQATQKTGKGIVSLQKQIEDIQKKFSSAGKDIFLGFFAPMAILQSVIGFISDEMAKAKQMAKDGLELLSKGETSYATSEEKKMANFFKAKQLREEEQRLAQTGIREMTVRFLEQTKQGQDMVKEFNQKLREQLGGKAGPYVGADTVSAYKQYQDAALKAFLASPEGKAYQPIFANQKDFKGPEGFSNVVGVGANPVIEAMNESIEIQKQQLEELKKISSPEGGVPSDFTKTTK